MITPALSRRTPLAELWLTEGDGVDVVADVAMLSGVTEWPESTVLVLGEDSWTLADAVVTGTRAIWTLTPTEADAVPVGVEAGRIQVGTGDAVRPVLAITAHRTPPNSGKAAGFSSVPVVVVGPPGPTAVSADADNVASLGTDGLIYVAPGAGTVSSVNGLTGAVVLTIPDSPDDIGAATAAQGAKADTASQPGHAHAQSDVTGLVTALAGKADAGHLHTGVYAPALGADDNYVTDAEKTALHSHSNKAALDLVSGTNTGDQTLPTWSTIAGKPAVVAEGATQADARSAIGAGTSSFSGAYADLSGKPTLGTAAAAATTDFATAAQGAKADTALQPATAQAVNAQTGTTYTLVAADAGKLVTLTNAAAITLTIPGSVFTTGQQVDCLVLGAGMVTSVGSSCTVNGTPSLVSRAQYSGFTVKFTSATTAVLIGDLA